MNEQNRLRLNRIAARHAHRTAQGASGTEAEIEANRDAVFLSTFASVRDEVLRPVMAEVGVQLKAAGYGFRISPGGAEGAPSIDFHILIADRGDSKDTIRFFARKDAERGWQVIGELELKRSPVELTRFEATERITHDVVEQLVVEAVEQMFASVPGAPRSDPLPVVPAVPPAPGPAPSVHEVVSTEPSQLAGAPMGEGAPIHVKLLPAVVHALDPALPLLPAAPEARWARWAGVRGMGETEEVNVAVFQRTALPFVKGPPAPAFFAETTAERGELRDRATGHETMVLPVVDAAGLNEPGAADRCKHDATPELTLEQYADLRAQLTLRGEEDAETWGHFGVTSREVKEALQARFAARFRQDPATQARFVDLVQRRSAELRGR